MIMMLLESRPVELAIYAACDKINTTGKSPKTQSSPLQSQYSDFQK